ncbi:carbohydrate porin [Altererythrobacter sp.]|uniref:carbohydrate porin n=1 Tax=Altererythrobacter sp. TaxID=1872480 RepID=UPI003CFE3DA2
MRSALPAAGMLLAALPSLFSPLLAEDARTTLAPNRQGSEATASISDISRDGSGQEGDAAQTSPGQASAALAVTQTAAAAAQHAGSLPPPPEHPAAPPIKARVLFSQFGDIPVSGDARDIFRYGGKIDGYFDIKGGAIGIDNSLSMHIHPEFKYGESANGEIGLLPSNTLLFYPGEGDVFDLNVNVTKRWKSGTTLTVGKVNVLDLAAGLPVVGGGGHEGFQNLAMALPPSAIVPGSIIGALFNKPTKSAIYRLWVFDPQLQSKKTGFESPFDKGVAFLGSITLPVKLGGKPGYYALKLAGSTRSELATEALVPVLVPAPGSGFGNRKGEFSAVLAGYQYLGVYPEAPGKGWGIFGQVYISHGDPTFLDKSGFIGISGNPRFRTQDRFGIAWYRYSLTDGLVNALANRLALEDEEGIEAFYTLGIDKHLRVTANLQVIDSAVSARDTGILAGMRVTASF